MIAHMTPVITYAQKVSVTIITTTAEELGGKLQGQFFYFYNPLLYHHKRRSPTLATMAHEKSHF